METLQLPQALSLALDAQSRGGSAIIHVVRGEGDAHVDLSGKVVVEGSGQVRGAFPSTIHQAAVGAAHDALQKRRSRLYSLKPSASGGAIAGIQGGTVDIFVEVLPATRSLVIVGAGHIAQPLANLGKLLSFHVTVIDDRPQFANRERFPRADVIDVGEFETALSRLTVDRDSFVVLVTRGHVHDFASLRYILTTDAAYVGMIGSKVRVRTVLDRLSTEGFDIETLNRVYAPIGIDIGSHTPEEIAVAIAAEIIDVYRQGSARHLKVPYARNE